MYVQICLIKRWILKSTLKWQQFSRGWFILLCLDGTQRLLNSYGCCVCFQRNYIISCRRKHVLPPHITHTFYFLQSPFYLDERIWKHYITTAYPSTPLPCDSDSQTNSFELQRPRHVRLDVPFSPTFSSQYVMKPAEVLQQMWAPVQTSCLFYIYEISWEMSESACEGYIYGTALPLQAPAL